MGVLTPALGAALAATLAGCYSPALRDCTVACSAPTDCAQDQVCGGDGLCAAPEVAGHCGSVASAGPDAGLARDAGMPPHDAMPPPADAMPPPPPPDAPVNGHLVVQIDGKGSVFLQGLGVCSSAFSSGDCTYDVALHVAQTAQTFGLQGDQFVSWTSATCGGQGATCTFTPVAATTTIAVKFDHTGGGL